jgi:hypothetical protein
VHEVPYLGSMEEMNVFSLRTVTNPPSVQRYICIYWERANASFSHQARSQVTIDF